MRPLPPLVRLGPVRHDEDDRDQEDQGEQGNEDRNEGDDPSGEPRELGLESWS